MPNCPKFIVDECTGPAVAKWVSSQGYETISIYDSFRGKSDIDILAMATNSGFVIITNDKDFGEMIFKEKLNHNGIILLRLNNERAGNKIEVLKKLFSRSSLELSGNFTVVTENTIRIIKTGG